MTPVNWLLLHTIQHSFFDAAAKLSLGVNSRVIKCCSTDNKSIFTYNLNGKLLRKLITEHLQYPHICHVDDDGSVLIADQNANLLKVRNSKQKDFSPLQLQPPVSRPRAAVFFCGHLYVTSWNEETIMKYVTNNNPPMPV